MPEMSWIDTRTLGWRDIAGDRTDDRQLRNALERGTLKIGDKHRLGHLIFSLREKFTVDLIRCFTDLWVPIGHAAVLADQVAPHFDQYLDIVRGELDRNAEYKAEKSEGRLSFDLVIRPMAGGASISYLLKSCVWSPEKGIAEGRSFDEYISNSSIRISLAEVVRSQIRFCVHNLPDEAADILP